MVGLPLNIAPFSPFAVNVLSAESIVCSPVSQAMTLLASKPASPGRAFISDLYYNLATQW